MPTPPSKPSSPRRPEEVSEEERRAFHRDNEVGVRVTAYLFSGALLYGGVGWGLDHWLGTSWFLPVGIVVGMGLSLYLIWFRYGTH